MERLQLRAMSAAEFNSYRTQTIEAYAADRVQAGDWNPSQAETLAARETDDLLPAGRRTAGMLLFAAENGNGEQVGNVWIALNQSRPGDAWIYDIEIGPQHRGKGYGRALLQAAEEEAQQHGAYTIGGRVSAANTASRNMFESSGYHVTSVVMRKSLDDAGG